jgi:hypothetical protein
VGLVANSSRGSWARLLFILALACACTDDVSVANSVGAGACWYGAGECQYTDSAGCTDLGGAFAGAGANCECACDADINDDNGVGGPDFGILSGCIGPVTPECTAADINCDGVVDDCDAAVMGATDVNGPIPDPTACARAFCGACDFGNGCATRTPGNCESQDGTYLGDGIPCP